MKLKQVSKLFLDEEGQGLVEYGLILTLVVIVVFSSLYLFGQSVFNLFEVIREEVLKL